MENGCQLRTFSKMAPRRSSSSSTRNGTTWVSWTSSSSLLAKPVTRLPLTIGAPSYVTRCSTPGAWQTAATGLPAS